MNEVAPPCKEKFTPVKDFQATVVKESGPQSADPDLRRIIETLLGDDKENYDVCWEDERGLERETARPYHLV